MANEIQTQIITTLTNPTSSTTAALLRAVFDHGAFILAQTNAAAFCDTVTVGFAADQVISIPASSKFTAATQGLFCAINRDPTNYVDLGPNNGGTVLPLVRLYPRTPIQFPVVPSVVMRWQASIAACDVQFVWLAK